MIWLKSNAAQTASGQYESPAVSVIETVTEGVLCASGDTKWYQNGGSGDFDYITEDEEWN